MRSRDWLDRSKNPAGLPAEVSWSRAPRKGREHRPKAQMLQLILKDRQGQEVGEGQSGQSRPRSPASPKQLPLPVTQGPRDLQARSALESHLRRPPAPLPTGAPATRPWSLSPMGLRAQSDSLIHWVPRGQLRALQVVSAGQMKERVDSSQVKPEAGRMRTGRV